MVIDTHTHAWGAPSVAHPWVNGNIAESVEQFDVDTVYTAEKLLADMDRLRIDEAVVVGYPIVEWTDNWYTVAVAEYDRLYGVVMLDHFGEDAAEVARETLAADGVVGMRIAPGQPYDRMWRGDGAGDPWLPDAIEEEAFWEAAVEEEVLVTISAGAASLEECRALIERYPELNYVFDAYGPLRADSPDEHYEAFARLADFDNVAVKASHMPYQSDEPFPYRDAHDLLRWTLEEFGRERVVWGSDFPNVTAIDATYAEAFNWLHHVEGLSERDREYLEGRAFREFAALE